MRWGPDEIRKIVELREQGRSWSQIARELGSSWNAVRNAYRRAVKAGLIERQGGNPPKDPVDQARERARRQQEIAELKRLLQRAAVIRDLKETIRQAALAAEPPPLLARPMDADLEEEFPVLVIGDVHVGQSTPARLTAGYEYNVEVTERQFEMLAQEVLRIWEQQRRVVRWRELLILDLGDDVENDDLHTTQHRLVDPIVIKQVQTYGRLLAGLILTLLQVFEHIRVERVPGNHGRTSKKAGYAGLAELDPVDSYDWLAGEFAAAFLRNVEDRVRIVNHESFYAVTEVMGHKIIFEHGSSLRGGSSWGGIPYYGIDRAAAAYRDLEGDFLALVLGHYHRPYILPSGYGGWVIGNGAFPPTTPFVVASKHRVVRPSQTLFSVHPKRGLTALWRLYLDTPRITPNKEAT